MSAIGFETDHGDVGRNAPERGREKGSLRRAAFDQRDDRTDYGIGPDGQLNVAVRVVSPYMLPTLTVTLGREPALQRAL